MMNTLKRKRRRKKGSDFLDVYEEEEKKGKM